MFQVLCIVISIISIAFSSGLIIGLIVKLNENPNLAINEITNDINFYFFATKIGMILIIPFSILAIAVVYFVKAGCGIKNLTKEGK